MDRNTSVVKVTMDIMDSESDAKAINNLIHSLAASGGGKIVLESRRYILDEPIVLRSGVILVGQGAYATILEASSKLRGPVVTTVDAEANYLAGIWFESEGMPVRFSLQDLTIDGANAELDDTHGAGCGCWLYGKGFSLERIEVTGCQSAGIVSVGPLRGGQETWKDQPESIFDVRVSNCRGDGFLMRGPHDSIISRAIISRCRGRGLAVETDGKTYNGACDVEYCHAYGTDDTAIDLAAKVKAGFLQGDTGRGAGVRIRGSMMTYVDRIESFKNRGGIDDYAVHISAPFAQIGLARVRADWGTSGVFIDKYARGVQISSLDVEGIRNKAGPVENTPNNGVGLNIEASHAHVNSCFIRNFDAGTAVVLGERSTGNFLRGRYLTCDVGIGKVPEGNEVFFYEAF